MDFPHHFETGTHPKKPKFLNDAEYASALDTLCKGCTDLLLTDDAGRVLLGKRIVQPQPDWWYGCGGRMKPGETPYESACRLLRRELNLDLTPGEAKHVAAGGRFQGVNCYSYAWQFRQQEPKEGGTADLSIVMTLRITEEEKKRLKFDNKEYERHEWLDPSEVIADCAKHVALRTSVNDLISLTKWNELVRGVGEDDSRDAEIGRAFREYLKNERQRLRMIYGEKKTGAVSEVVKRPKVVM